MKSLLAIFATTLAVVAAVVVFNRDLEARGLPHGVLVERVGANQLRVWAQGRWQDVPLMPLASSLCDAGDPYFERYCH